MNIFINQLNELINTDKVERRVFLSVHAAISDRVFTKGKAANGSDIGQYSDGYVKRRVKNNWGSSRKVILQFSGQMKNDFSIIREGGEYGSGFKNNKNGDKSRWVEETYKKEIFSPTKQEEQLANELYGSELKRVLRGS